MELSKQEMELFLLYPDLWSKNFFYEMFLNFINESTAGLTQTWFWKQEIELSKQEMELSVSLAPTWNPARPELSLGQGYYCIHIHVCLSVCVSVWQGKRTFP